MAVRTRFKAGGGGGVSLDPPKVGVHSNLSNKDVLVIYQIITNSCADYVY